MGRAERRRRERSLQKEMKHQVGKYVQQDMVSKTQINSIVEELVAEKLKICKDDIMEEAVSRAMILTLILPCKVLMEHYWKKTYKDKLPEFVEYVLEYFMKWENGELDIEDLKDDLWENGGVKFERNL